MNYNHEPLVMDTTPQPEMTDDLRKMMDNSYMHMRRTERNKLLDESDKYVLQDFPISLEDKMKILTWRQELRDFDFNDFSKVFPNKPYNK
jgi:hypothetical protein